jgi:hypothetical protein
VAVSQNPARAARRTRELRDKLDSEQPVCFYCGYAEIAVLRRVSRRLLEKHHLFGRNHDPNLTVHVCLNCHALQHERLLDASVDLRPEANPVKRVITMLRAEAVHHEALAGTKRLQAALLEASLADTRR